jgi:hypothetical protein
MSQPAGPSRSEKDIRPETTASVASSVTDLHANGSPHPSMPNSAIPEDKRGEILENLEDDWQHDHMNPRNWSLTKKWVRISIQSHLLYFRPNAYYVQVAIAIVCNILMWWCCVS